MIINRFKHHPSKHTFKISPIRDLLSSYIKPNEIWIDPFSGENSPATITNDINPSIPADYHLPAFNFLQLLHGSSFNGCIFDPPYSTYQAKRTYHILNLDFTLQHIKDYSRWTKEKHLIRDLILPGGYFISFGWNTNGIGKTNGFFIIEILIINHGPGHNDTLCTVEQKLSPKMPFQNL